MTLLSYRKVWTWLFLKMKYIFKSIVCISVCLLFHFITSNFNIICVVHSYHPCTSSYYLKVYSTVFSVKASPIMFSLSRLFISKAVTEYSYLSLKFFLSSLSSTSQTPAITSMHTCLSLSCFILLFCLFYF